MKIKNNARYHVATSGYTGYATMTGADLKAYVKDETTRARRYFGAAVCHNQSSEMRPGTFYFKITARRDERSALWVNITAHLH